MMISRSALFLAIGLSTALAGCTDKDVILPGLREPIRSDTGVMYRASAPLNLVAPQTNANWTHRQGNAAHNLAHPALPNALAPAFTVSIGAGEGRRTRIDASPVIAAGRIFTMDAHAQVSARTLGGAPLWARQVNTAYDAPRQGASGGLAYGDGKLFVTTGFGRLIALDPTTGAEIWTQKLEGVGGASPTVADGLVYVAARNGVGWAIDTDTGRVRWTLNATPDVAGVATGAGVAVAGPMAVFPFVGGDLRGVLREGGMARWSAVLAGSRLGHASATFSDIAGDPVIAGDRVYVANASGRTAALDIASGETIWDVPMAARAPIWVAGGSVFMVNDLNELVRLDAQDGAVVWRVELPQYAPSRFSLFRQVHRYYAHYGPILAGGRLIVASSDGVLRQFDPVSGQVLAQSALSAPAAAMPAVAGNTLYVVTTDGRLTAFR